MGVWTEGDTGIDVCFHFIPYLKLRISVILFSHPVVKRREAYDVAAPAGTRAVWFDKREATARNVQNEEEKNDGGNSRKGERDKRVAWRSTSFLNSYTLGSLFLLLISRFWNYSVEE